MNPKHYSMTIQWDNDDKIYIVTVPELPGCKTHDKTHNKAIKNALIVIELWIEAAQEMGRLVPHPDVYTID